MDKLALKEMYGTSDVAAIVKAKQTTRQTKVFSTAMPLEVTMTPDECKRLCDGLKKEYLPGYENRILGYVTTTEATDRYGDIVRATGADLVNYKKNPVVMFAHQHDNFPVGCSLRISIDAQNKTIPADALFLDDRVDPSGRSDLVFKFAKSRFMPACSISLMPTKTNRPVTEQERLAVGLGEYGVEFQQWEYLEFSPCAIPANPEALQMALKSCDLATFHKEDIDMMERVKFFTGNLLDIFAETVKGNVDKTIIIPPVESVQNVPDPVVENHADDLTNKEVILAYLKESFDVNIPDIVVRITDNLTPALKSIEEKLLTLFESIKSLKSETPAKSSGATDKDIYMALEDFAGSFKKGK